MGVAGTSQISSNPAIKTPPVAQRITDEEYLLDYKEAKALLESKDMKNRADGMVNMSRIPYVDSFTDVQIAEILIAHVAVSLVASELKPINRKLQCESVLRADQGMSLLVSRGYSRLDIKGSFSPNAKDMYKKAFALAAPFDCEKEGYSY